MVVGLRKNIKIEIYHGWEGRVWKNGLYGPGYVWCSTGPFLAWVLLSSSVVPRPRSRHPAGPPWAQPLLHWPCPARDEPGLAGLFDTTTPTWWYVEHNSLSLSPANTALSSYIPICWSRWACPPTHLFTLDGKAIINALASGLPLLRPSVHL